MASVQVFARFITTGRIIQQDNPVVIVQVSYLVAMGILGVRHPPPHTLGTPGTLPRHPHLAVWCLLSLMAPCLGTRLPDGTLLAPWYSTVGAGK